MKRVCEVFSDTPLFEYKFIKFDEALKPLTNFIGFKHCKKEITTVNIVNQRTKQYVNINQNYMQIKKKKDSHLSYSQKHI